MTNPPVVAGAVQRRIVIIETSPGIQLTYALNTQPALLTASGRTTLL